MNLGVDINSLGYKVVPDRFYVSKDGYVYDCVKKKVLSTTNRNGYLCVTLYDKSKYDKGRPHTKHEYLHRIIAKAFINNANNLPCINHRNGNKQDNSLENLEWCSKRHNIQHAYSNGLRKNGHGGGKNAPVICLDTGEKFRSIAEAAKITNANASSISNCLAGRAKTCSKKRWEYI